jgi:hypothetical protein
MVNVGGGVAFWGSGVTVTSANEKNQHERRSHDRIVADFAHQA